MLRPKIGCYMAQVVGAHSEENLQRFVLYVMMTERITALHPRAEAGEIFRVHALRLRRRRRLHDIVDARAFDLVNPSHSCAKFASVNTRSL